MVEGKQMLGEVVRDFYVGKEALERKKQRGEKDLQEVVRHDFGERRIING